MTYNKIIWYVEREREKLNYRVIKHSGGRHLQRRVARGTSGFQFFFSRVHLVPGLVPETACGFSWFESDIPPGGVFRGDLRTEKKGSR